LIVTSHERSREKKIQKKTNKLLLLEKGHTIIKNMKIRQSKRQQLRSGDKALVQVS
jgi:hypothetical protein